MKDYSIIPFDRIKETLDVLGQSTGDTYWLYDFSADRVFFSGNTGMPKEVFLEEGCCTLKEWREEVDERDICRLKKITEELTSRKISSYNFNYRVKGKKGKCHWINSRGRAYCGADGSLVYVLGRLSCSSIRKPAEVFNIQELKREISEILENGIAGYLMIIGIDDLKSINLHRGRDFGDEVLTDLAYVLNDELEGDHTLFRINGDCFAVNVSLEGKRVEALFERVQKRMKGQCTVSGGCVAYQTYPVADAGMFFQYGETALDYSKTNGKNILTFFSQEMYEEKLRKAELQEILKKSIEADFEGFEVYYQAQVRSETYELYGAEALLRYRSPGRGNISPAEFIPVLEQSGMICRVGLWVLQEALKTCREWRRKIPEFHMSVNISYGQLEQESIEEDVLECVRRSGVPGGAVTLEVTESMQLCDYPHLNRLFRKWKQYGIRIAVDDFGTGYSSLSCLKEMAVDELKIDRCFVSGIQNSAYNYRLLHNIIELAESSRLSVCCEGIEKEKELDVLEELHPALYQGYLFARPCTKKEFEGRYLASCTAMYRKREKTGRKEGSWSDRREIENEISRMILNAENNIFYLSDVETYELYYMNPPGQKMFGVKDYRGKTCYKVIHGKDAPCSFCSDAHLRQDSFYIWENKNEYCGCYFLIKGKLAYYRGKKVRLEVAMDITGKEYISQSAGERLIFAEKIPGYMKALTDCENCREAIVRVLACVGDFYQADQVFLFEPDGEERKHWDSTFEWCAREGEVQKEWRQGVPENMVLRWGEKFQKGDSVTVLNVDGIRQDYPEEWEFLKERNIHCLIAAPVCSRKGIAGFVGVSNPRRCIHDDTQAKVLAGFLMFWLWRRGKEQEERKRENDGR